MEKGKENNSNKENKITSLKEEEVKKYLKDLEEWELSSEGDKIFRKFEFKTFKKAIYFVNQVAHSCKKIDHYPATITIRSNKVKIELTTNKIGGLSKKDFTLADKIDFMSDWEDNFRRWLASPKIIIIILLLFLLMLLLQYLL
ncbi:MAG: 4a-hydroxytetrahydrobiopterin dehydratase [Candidatus Woesearchaeota archaeon]